MTDYEGPERRRGDAADAAWQREIPDAEWDDAVARIRATGEAGGEILLLCHSDPDGDALGSLLALHLSLGRLGFRSVASWGSEPFQVPPQYTFLPGLDELTPPAEVPRDPALVVTLDAGSRDRLGSLAGLVDGRPTIVVDHHASNTRFGTTHLVAASAAATAVLTEELISRLGGDVDTDLAACLYVGLVTDTGRFQYANTDRSAMELGSRLLDRGIDHDAMSRQMFDTHSFGYLKVMGRMLDRAVFVPRASLVHGWVTENDLNAYGVAVEELEDLIDLLRTVDSAEVAMMSKETGPGEWRVSLRSKGRIDVGRLAQHLGGGGHAFSAGFSAQLPLDELVARVVDVLGHEDVVTADAGTPGGGS
ncbi:MAG: bifunctional oligoribonuclease/PAP phosphatase NrnA [Actinobacteria bacterium]|nr:bifunctional oligoribonuclease/PAP phosphatase NrnA [Actinomycetota bacterium]